MDIIERGNANIMRAIQKKAHAVTEQKVQVAPAPSLPVGMGSEGGAYASMMRKRAEERGPVVQPAVRSPLVEAPAVAQTVSPAVAPVRVAGFRDHLLASVVTLGETGEYFNALSALFTLYGWGESSREVLGGLSVGDEQELLGILRDFQQWLSGRR